MKVVVSQHCQSSIILVPAPSILLSHVLILWKAVKVSCKHCQHKIIEHLADQRHFHSQLLACCCKQNTIQQSASPKLIASLFLIQESQVSSQNCQQKFIHLPILPGLVIDILPIIELLMPADSIASTQHSQQKVNLSSSFLITRLFQAYIIRAAPNMNVL